MSKSEAPLMVTISGIRGIAGESLTEDVVRMYVRAFADIQRKKDKENRLVVVGRDSRVSGPWIRDCAVETLQRCGMDVEDCGIVPTPTVQYMVQRRQAVGGLIITSSHNPKPWNGLKFVDTDGLFLAPDRCTTMFAHAKEVGGEPFSCYEKTLGALRVLEKDEAVNRQVAEIMSLPYVDPAAVRAEKLKVCLDTVCGAGGPAMTKVLETLGCEVVPLNIETTGEFPHTPEPIPENLGDLCRAVVENKADLGIAVDPDVDRCVLIGEDGKPLVEEYTLALAVEFILGYVGRRGVVCKNLSSSRALDDIAAKYPPSTVVATAVGEINVAKKMEELHAVIGGEGNGGVMLPDIHIGRDAPVAATLALMCFARWRAEQRQRGTGKSKISELKASLPQYEIVKTKIETKGLNPALALETLKNEYLARGGEFKVSTLDGLHISGSDWWAHIRLSNTEPIMRVICEAPTRDAAAEKCQHFLDRLAHFKA